MNEKTILRKIMLPIIIMLMIIPVVSGSVFYISITRYTYRQARREMDSLNESVRAAMERNLGETDDRVNANNFDNREDDRLKLLISQVALIASGNSGNGRIVILSGEDKVVYPKDEEQRKEIQKLINEFDTLVKEDTGDIKKVKLSNGDRYLVTMHDAQVHTKRFGKIIVYCNTENMGRLIKWSTVDVFIVVILSAIVIFFTIYTVCKKIIKSLTKLCNEAERIGSGNFKKIEEEFSVQELKSLQKSMNYMIEQLKDADEMQKMFFQNASHELRNPLMSISGYAQGIEQGVFDDDRQAAHTIVEESTRLTEIVESLLTLSRLDAHKVEVNVELIDVQDIVENCIDRIYGLAVRKKVDILFDRVSCKVQLESDRKMLEKILDNFLSNAVRYAKGKVDIVVKNNLEKINISVIDDGEGIDNEDMPHIFERCYKGKGGNYGIGLAIVAGVAKILNADITVYNTKSGGACFEVELFQKWIDEKH